MLHQNIEHGQVAKSLLGPGNKRVTLKYTLGATFTISAEMPNVLFLDPGGAARTVLLPAEADGLAFTIANTGDGQTEYLNVYEDGGSVMIGTVSIGEVTDFVCDGTTWRAFGRQAGGVIATTATQLAITKAQHDGKTILINSAAPLAVSLPAAVGAGWRVRFVVGVAATGTSHTIAANGADVMEGVIYALTTSSDNVIGYKHSATSDKISMNGTTTGGVPGDTYLVEDLEAGVIHVQGWTAPTGSYATPFSAT